MRPPATRRGLLPGIQERIILWRVSPIYIFFVLTKAPAYTLQTEYEIGCRPGQAVLRTAPHTG